MGTCGPDAPGIPSEKAPAGPRESHISPEGPAGSRVSTSVSTCAHVHAHTHRHTHTLPENPPKFRIRGGEWRTQADIAGQMALRAWGPDLAAVAAALTPAAHARDTPRRAGCEASGQGCPWSAVPCFLLRSSSFLAPGFLVYSLPP